MSGVDTQKNHQIGIIKKASSIEKRYGFGVVGEFECKQISRPL